MLKDARVVDVAARRIARGRGVKGFANARTCRTALERAYQVSPRPFSLLFTLDDGPSLFVCVHEIDGAGSRRHGAAVQDRGLPGPSALARAGARTETGDRGAGQAHWAGAHQTRSATARQDRAGRTHLFFFCLACSFHRHALNLTLCPDR